MRARFLCFRVLALLLLAACQSISPNSQTQTPNGARLTHGPLAGAVTDTAATLWVRTSTAAQVTIRYSPNPALTGALESAPAATGPATDFTTNVRISGLAPQREYWYDVQVNGVPALRPPYPRFKTFAPPGASASFRVLVLSDFRTISRITRATGTFRAAANEAPDVVILGGDMDHRNPATREDKRQMFRDVYTAANRMEDLVQLILPRYPLVHFWDDHDYGANNADKTYADKALSLEVLREYFPVYPVSPHGDWQRFTYGQADFFVLDSRSQRDPVHDPDGPSKSMLDGDNLGTAGQWEWLKEGLQNSKATWKFILSPVIFNPTTKRLDGWAGYGYEREAILGFIAEKQISGVVVVSGDLHAGAIDDGTFSGLPEMVVPTANDGYDKRCLTEPSGNVGEWSVGHYGDASGTPCNGYGVVSVLTNPDRALLEVKDDEGRVRVSYEVRGNPKSQIPNPK